MLAAGVRQQGTLELVALRRREPVVVDEAGHLVDKSVGEVFLRRVKVLEVDLTLLLHERVELDGICLVGHDDRRRFNICKQVVRNEALVSFLLALAPGVELSWGQDTVCVSCLDSRHVLIFTAVDVRHVSSHEGRVQEAEHLERLHALPDDIDGVLKSVQYGQGAAGT